MRTKELSIFLRNAVENGASTVLMETNVVPELITKSQAYRLYGRCNVDRWILEGILKAISNKTTQILLDHAQLEVIAASSNRITYLQVVER